MESYNVRALNYLLKPIDEEKLISTLNYYIEKITIPRKAEKLIIYLNTNEKLEIYRTISDMEELLREKKSFIRIHRSFIINMYYIKEITSDEVTLLSNYKLPLSKKYSSSFKNAYFEFAKQHFS